MVTTALVAALVAQQPAITGERSLVSKCEVSADPEYGYTREKPIKVGGLPMYGPARQRRFLQALSGPAGQPITFTRRGSLAPNAEQIILDLYEVTYPGLDKPIELFLDLYRWDPPKAPRGLVCAIEIGLAPPPPDPGESRRRLIEAAVNWSGGAIQPIPFAPEAGARMRAFGFDPFRLVVLAARDAAAKGTPLSAQDAMGIQTPAALVVAAPVRCPGGLSAPAAITFVDSQQRVLHPNGPLLKGETLQKLLPGFALEPGVVGAPFDASWPIRGFVRVAYDSPACGDPVHLPVTAGPPQKVIDMKPAWPAGVPVPPSGETIEVTIRASIGVDGVPSDPQVTSPASAFDAAALEAVRAWRYLPMTINGERSYVPITMNVRVTFSRK